MSDEYITIMPDHFKGIAGALKWKGLEIPEQLKMVRGYTRPEYSQPGGGLPEFQSWIEKTVATNDGEVLQDSIRYLELQLGYYDWLEHIDECFSKDGRIASKLGEGLKQLNEGLENIS